MSDYREIELLAENAKNGAMGIIDPVSDFRDKATPSAILSMVGQIKQLNAWLECARGDLKTAMEIAEKNRIDAERYRQIRDGVEGIIVLDNRVPDYVECLDCFEPEELDSVIDLDIEKERT